MTKAQGKKKLHSLYTKIIGSFIILILAAVLLGLLLMRVVGEYTSYSTKDEDDIRFSAWDQAITAKDYQDIMDTDVYGKKGYIEVLDSALNVVYNSKGKAEGSYSEKFVNLLPSIQSGAYYEVEIEQIGEHYRVVATLYEEDSTENDFGFIPIGTFIFDDNGMILYSDLDFLEKGELLSYKEMDLLFQEGDGGSNISKYVSTSEGETYYVVIHDRSSEDHVYEEHYKRLLYLGISAYVIALVLLIFLVAMSIKNSIKIPLDVLREGMENFATGQKERLPLVEGPTELRDMIETFNNMSDTIAKGELENKKEKEQKQKMLADISHDLKTPITVILGYSKAIDDGVTGEEKTKAYLKAIYKKADLLNELINQFAQYSQLEHPDFSLDLKEGNYTEFVREYFAQEYEALDLSGFELDVDIPEDEIKLKFDGGQMQRVFGNIVGNATKHNPSGSVIHVKLEKKESEVTLYIGDDGEGISEELKDHIFEPFVIGDDARRSGKGTGLGLSIAKRIVLEHGGDLTLLDNEKGCWFAVTLPCDLPNN
ncbi:MAG: HAMP domain-containing histidine kinase [Lachnospiraceae bacterium]|nr:HAMP domain-containing histidine kinase [Lachnospiraceae bacterium]